MLNELWDRGEHWETDGNGKYKFKVDGAGYKASFVDGSELFSDYITQKEFKERLISNGDFEKFIKRNGKTLSIYEVSFGYDIDGWKAYRIEMNKDRPKGSAVKVLSTVVDIFKDGVSWYRPNIVWFTGKRKRVPVYNKLAKHLARLVGYDYTIFEGTSGVIKRNLYILYKT